MTTVRLPDGGLLLHSPIPISDSLAEALAALGPVRHIVAPSQLHHLYFGEVAARYPDATTWAAPGLAAKRPDLRFQQTLQQDDPPWADVLEPLWVDGIPWMNETAFFHAASGTLLVTDLFFHITHAPNWQSRLLFSLVGVYGRPAQSLLVRLQTRDKAAAAASARRILDRPIQRLVPCHGIIVEEGAQDQIARVLQPMIARGGLALT